MFDSHVTMAAVATRVELGRQGIMVTRDQAAAIFRDAAAAWAEARKGGFDMAKFESDEEFSVDVERELWAGYEQWLDEQADRHEYELSLEMM